MTLKSSDRKQRGQAMVEFALLLPLFLAVLFLIIDFGVGINRWVIVTNSTREGARIGAVGASKTAIIDRVALTSNGLLDPDPASGDIDVRYVDLDNNGEIDRGDSVVVESDYEYGLITPLGAFLSIAFDKITFHSCTDMRLELPISGAGDIGGDVCS